MEQSLRGMRRVVAVVATSAMALLAAPAVPARAEGVFAGACLAEIVVNFSPGGGGMVPKAGAHSLGGTGTCVVNGAVAPLTLVGGILVADPTTGFGCAAGVAHGDVQFVLGGVPGFPNPEIQLLVSVHGGVVTVAGFALLTRFEGVGEMAQAPATTAQCASGGSVSTARWTGPFAFQDPDPSPVR